MIAAVLLLASLGLAMPSPPAIPDTARGMLHGQILSEGSDRPIPYALVQARAGSVYRIALADAHGRYVLRDVPVGSQTIRASAIDHQPLEIVVEVPGTADLSVDLSLRLRPIELEGVTVRADRYANPVPEEPSPPPVARGSPADPALRALEGSPGAAELGLADALQARRPGPVDTTGVLFVRGAASDLRLVLLDGAPVYAPFHLAGLIDAFLPDVLGSARLYTGGAPARYDGGLSHILVLEPRAGRRTGPAWSGFADLVSAGSRIEGPLPLGSYLAAGRVLHGGDRDLVGADLPYRYVDGLVHLDLSPALGHEVTATGFYNRESVRLEGGTEITAFPPARWGNTAGSLRYRGDWGRRRAEITAALGAFVTRLPVGGDAPLLARGRLERARLTADLAEQVGAVRLTYGAAYERQRIVQRTESQTGTLFLRRREVGEAVALHGDAGWPLAGDLHAQAGLRMSAFVPDHGVRIAPRVGLTWRASDHSRLSMAAGRYHQYVNTGETALSGDLGEGFTPVRVIDGTGNEELLAVSGATHLTLRLDHVPRNDLMLGVETFYKTFDQVGVIDGLRASGVELWADWRHDDWAAWGGYSLAWVWSERVDTIAADRFSARQLIRAGLRVPLPSEVRLDFELASSAGLPFASVPITRDGGTQGETTNDAPQPPLAGAPEGSYLRLDLKLSRSWSAELFGTPFQVSPYLKLLNALDRRDAIFYQFDTGRDLRPRSLEAIPFLPVLGIEWGL